MSTIKVDTLVAADGSSAVTLPKQTAAKAFAHSSSGSVLSSFNVSSTSDIGTGQYRSTYTNNMADAEQCVSTNAFRDSDQYIGNRSNDNTSSYHQLNCFTRGGNTRADSDTAMGVAFGEYRLSL